MTTGTIAVIFLVLAAASAISVALASAGIIKRNRWIGIRTSATLSSDDAWHRGHRAGLIPATIGGATGAVFAIAGLITAGTPGQVDFAAVMLGCSIAATLAGGVWSTIRASRSARA